MQKLNVCRKIFENLLIDNNVDYNLWFIYLYVETKIFFSKNIKEIKKRFFFWIFFRKKINKNFYFIYLFFSLKKLFGFNAFFSDYIKILFLKNTKHNTHVFELAKFFFKCINNFIHLKKNLLNFFKVELKLGNVENSMIYLELFSLKKVFSGLSYSPINKMPVNIYRRAIFLKKYVFFSNRFKNNIHQTESARYTSELSKSHQFLKCFIPLQVLMMRRFVPSIFNYIQKKMSNCQNIFLLYCIYFRTIFYFRKMKKNLLLLFLSYFS
nr:hypothetical protein CparaKRNrm2_p091 [Cryptomonas paramecium]